MNQRRKENLVHLLAAAFLLFLIVISPASFTAALSTQSWHMQAAPGDGYWKSVAWSPSQHLFVAVGHNAVMTSPDGASWTTGTMPSGEWRAVTWSPERGIFVAVGFGHAASGNDAATSPDGLSWTVQTTPAFTPVEDPEFGNEASYGIWNAVTWSPERGLFVAVGENATGSAAETIMTSSDGVSWAFQSAPLAALWRSVAWSPALGRFVAVGFENSTMGSSDGIVWEMSPAVGSVDEGGSPGFGGWHSVVWSPELGIFVAVSEALNERTVITSSDGTLWTPRRSVPGHYDWKSIAWSPELGIFTAVSVNDAFMTSPDGVVWTDITPPDSRNWSSVAWSPELGVFVAVVNSAAPLSAATSDNVVPNIDPAVSASPSDEAVTVSWTTDIKASSQVRYGTTDEMALSTDLDSTLSRSHTVTLSGLTPCTDYRYQAVSAYAGETSSSDILSFKTTGCVEPVPERRNAAVVPPLDLVSGGVATPSETTQDETAPAETVSEDIASQPAEEAPVVVASPTPALFTHTLKKGVTDPEVKMLQVFLNAHGYVVSATGAGAPGNETDFYGAQTWAAVVRFQRDHADEILAPLMLAAPTGIFGPATMRIANGMVK